jgi:tetratricopeptide (TPR) repeat protein
MWHISGMHFGRFFAAALVSLTTVHFAAFAQQGGWDPYGKGSPEFGTGASSPLNISGAQRNATLDHLDKVLSTSQLPVLDRLAYLNLRAFQYSKLNRESDAQKDIAEMAKLMPQAWPVLLASNTAFLAGGGDRASALKLMEYGLRTKPGDTWLIIGQAEIYMQLADHPRAVSLLDSAVSTSPRPVDRQSALYSRGLANFNLGNFPQSVEDFDGTLSTRTTLKARLMPVLWRYAAQVRARRDARTMLVREIGNENLHEWPGPIARFLLGQITPGELEVAAESDPNSKQSNGKCVAPFFIGIEAVRRGDKQRAREQFQLTQARCSTVSSPNWAAASELKRL